MYMPSHFEESRSEILHDFIRSNPFGALVTLGVDGLDANHLPFELILPNRNQESPDIPLNRSAVR